MRGRRATLTACGPSHLPALGPNVELPGRYYPVRAFATREDLAKCLASMAMALDYDNFKNEVANKHIHTRATIYHDVWQDCRKIANVVSRGPEDVARSSVGKARSRPNR